MTSDYELLDRWRGGDRDAGSMLFDRYFKEMARFFENKRCRDVEDLVQTTFLACVQNRDSFRDQCSFRTYLFSIARRQLYKHFRTLQRHGGNLDFGVTSLADLATGPADHLARNQRHMHLLHALHALPLEQQLLLEMYYWESMEMADLATIFDIAPATVRTRLFRARQALRERLAQLDEASGLSFTTEDNFDAWARSLRNDLDEG